MKTRFAEVELRIRNDRIMRNSWKMVVESLEAMVEGELLTPEMTVEQVIAKMRKTLEG